jgi:Mg/Co/Ni transporter MgtE
MNQTINKIVQSIEFLSGEERHLLFEQLIKRKLFDIEQQPEEYLKESLAMAESDFNDYLSNLEDYEDKLAKGEK